MNLNLDAVAVKAVCDAMTEEQRAEMVKQVFTQIMAKTDGYGANAKSLMERSMEKCAALAIERHAEEYFKERDAELQALAEGIIKKTLEGKGRDQLIEKIASTITANMDRYG